MVFSELPAPDLPDLYDPDYMQWLIYRWMAMEEQLIGYLVIRDALNEAAKASRDSEDYKLTSGYSHRYLSTGNRDGFMDLELAEVQSRFETNKTYLKSGRGARHLEHHVLPKTDEEYGGFDRSFMLPAYLGAGILEFDAGWLGKANAANKKGGVARYKWSGEVTFTRADMFPQIIEKYPYKLDLSIYRPLRPDLEFGSSSTTADGQRRVQEAKAITDAFLKSRQDASGLPYEEWREWRREQNRKPGTGIRKIHDPSELEVELGETLIQTSKLLATSKDGKPQAPIWERLRTLSAIFEPFGLQETAYKRLIDAAGNAWWNAWAGPPQHIMLEDMKEEADNQLRELSRRESLVETTILPTQRVPQKPKSAMPDPEENRDQKVEQFLRHRREVAEAKERQRLERTKPREKPWWQDVGEILLSPLILPFASPGALIILSIILGFGGLVWLLQNFGFGITGIVLALTVTLIYFANKVIRNSKR